MNKLKVLNKGSDIPSLWTEDSMTKCQFFPTWYINSMQFQLKKKLSKFFNGYWQTDNKSLYEEVKAQNS